MATTSFNSTGTSKIIIILKIISTSAWACKLVVKVEFCICVAHRDPVFGCVVLLDHPQDSVAVPPRCRTREEQPCLNPYRAHPH
jgi:hypothetical protein